MPKRLQRVLTSLKEQSSVNYAKMVTVGGFCSSIDLIIIKATAPDDLPLPEKYIRELLSIFSISQTSFRAFSLSFTRRFGKTKCWRVALKCLLLLHRLLRSLPQNSPLRTELILTRSNGLISLFPCHFQDRSSSNSHDYTAFIRSYAQLLHEVLNCSSLDNKETHNQEVEEEDDDEMKEVVKLLEYLPQIQSLIDRAMDCRPFGSAARSFMVQAAMKYIIRDSFVCYTTYRKEIVGVLDNLFKLPYRRSVSAFGIYKKAAVQSNQLCEFYDWCKAKGLCGPYEYPFIERIPNIQIQALETLLDGMWQLTDSSPSQSSGGVEPHSQSSSTEEGDDGRDRKSAQLLENNVVPNKFCGGDEEPLIKFEGGGDEEPLIKFEDGDDEESWETLLDASISLTPAHPNYLCSNLKMQDSNQNALTAVFYPSMVPNFQ